MLKFLFDRQAVVAELRQGPLKPVRAKKFLLFFLAFSTVVRALALAPQLFAKQIGLTEVLGPIAVTLAALVLVYFVTVALLNRLYEANGGDDGRNFYERLFVLFLHAAVLLVGPLTLLAAAGLVFIFWIIRRPGFESSVMFIAFGYGLLLVILPAAFLYKRVKSGLLQITGGSGESPTK